MESLEGIEELKQLTTLDCSYNQLESLEGIEKLSQLTRLYCFGNQLKSLDGIEKLSQLTELDCSYNQLESLKGIEKLSQLTTLDCGYNQLESLEGIEKLSQLTDLDCGGNQLKSLDRVEKLSQLTMLNCFGNQLKSLDGVEKLSQLTELSCAYNPLEELPDCWDRFPSLRYVDLSGLSLPSLPSSLLQCRLPLVADDKLFRAKGKIRGIVLENTQLALQPVSLFDQSRDTSPDRQESRKLIDDYLNAAKVPIREGKVILLGNGHSGKTHTVSRMLDDCRPGEPGQYNSLEETHGILINDLRKTINGEDYTLRFWDFGGQDVMHEMHRCFLTERTLYVILIDTRSSNQNSDASYWLQTVRKLAPHSKALLLANDFNDGNYALDGPGLRAKFPDTLLDIIQVNVRDSGEEEFRQKVEERLWAEAQRLDCFRMELPENWEAVRQELLQMKGKESDGTETYYYISRSRYYEICDSHDVPKDEGVRTWLLTLFNDLGVCFSYHLGEDGRERTDDYHILEPLWLTGAAYRLICMKLGSDDGIITRREIESELAKKGSQAMLKNGYPCIENVSYSSEECEYVLDIMRMFFLSFPADETHEFIPACCTPDSNMTPQPESWELHCACKFVYDDVLPASILHKLMIYCYQNIRTGKRWKQGFWLESEAFGLKAVVAQDKDLTQSKEIRIDIYSTKTLYKPWQWMQQLCEKLMEINRSSGIELNPELFLLGENMEEQTWFGLEKIWNWKKKGVKTLQGDETLFNIDGLLTLFYGDALPEQKDAHGIAEKGNKDSLELFTQEAVKNATISPFVPSNEDLFCVLSDLVNTEKRRLDIDTISLVMLENMMVEMDGLKNAITDLTGAQKDLTEQTISLTLSIQAIKNKTLSLTDEEADEIGTFIQQEQPSIWAEIKDEWHTNKFDCICKVLDSTNNAICIVASLVQFFSNPLIGGFKALRGLLEKLKQPAAIPQLPHGSTVNV